MKTLEELRSSIMRDAEAFFGRGNGIAHALLFIDGPDENGSLAVVAMPDLDGRGMRAALDNVCAQVNPYAGVLMFEAWAATLKEGEKRTWAQPKDAPDRKDVISIIIDHPEGILAGEIEVFEGRTPRLDTKIRWIEQDASSGYLGHIVPRHHAQGVHIH